MYTLILTTNPNIFGIRDTESYLQLEIADLNSN